MNKNLLNSLAVLLGVLGLSTTVAHAVGFRLPNQDPDAIARGNAFVATADNPSAIYYNPAGISQLEGQNFRAGVYLVSGDIRYTSPSGEKAEVDSKINPVPQLYYAGAIQGTPLSFGLGVYAPYGLSVDWHNPPFRNIADSGRLTYMTINPVIAWRIRTNLSIGVGPTINYSDAEFERGLGLGVFPGDRFTLKGDGWAYGFNAGLRWQPHEKWVFGVNYRYVTEVEYEGTAEFMIAPPLVLGSSSTASITFPQFVVAGISFRPTEKWNLEFNIDWTDWDNVNSIVINNTPMGTLAWPLNYQSSLMYEFGVTYKLPKDYFVSAGYFFSENSSPDEDFNPIIPDTNLHLGSFGFGYKGPRWNWTIAYHFGFNPGRDVENATTFPQANGTYEVFNQAINLAVGIKF